MPSELVRITTGNGQIVSGTANVPELVERAGVRPGFREEFFFAEHHNPHTQKAYQRAVRRFLAWAKGEGVELASISPGMVGQYLTALGGSPPKRNQHLAALRGFFDRLVQRHVVFINPAALVRGVKEKVVEGKTPEITLEQTRKLIASVKTIRKPRSKKAKATELYDGGEPAGPGDPVHAAVHRLPGRCRCKAAAPGFPARRRAVRAAVSGEGRNKPRNPGAAGIAAGYIGVSGSYGHQGRCPGQAAVPLDGAEDEATNRQRTHQQSDMRAG